MVKSILSLGLCNSEEIQMAKECLVHLNAGLEEDADYAEPYQLIKPGEDFEGRMPEHGMLPQMGEGADARMADFLYELVELPDQDLAQKLRIDVNLWRRQQLVHPTFSLTGSNQQVW